MTGWGSHQRSKVHRSSIRATCCQRLPTRRAAGSPSCSVRTSTGSGVSLASLSDGSTGPCRARDNRRRMPGRHPRYSVEGVSAAHHGSGLSVDLYKAPALVVAGILQQFHLGSRLACEVGQGETHLLHGAGWGIRLQPTFQGEGGLFPGGGGLFEPEIFLPWGPTWCGTEEVRSADSAAFHVGPGVRPFGEGRPGPRGGRLGRRCVKGERCVPPRSPRESWGRGGCGRCRCRAPK